MTTENTPGPRRQGQRIESQLEILTERELEVLRLIGDGLSTAEIAKHLHRSEQTVKSHRRTLGRKLGARNRVDLARMAIRAGLSSIHHRAASTEKADSSPSRHQRDGLGWLLAESSRRSRLPMATLTAEGHLSHCNDAWAELTGRTVEGAAGHAITSMLEPASALGMEQCLSQAARGDAASTELRFRFDEGPWRTCFADVTAVRDRAGRLGGYTVTLLDISELIRDREELAAAKRELESLSRRQADQARAESDLMRSETDRRRRVEWLLQEVLAGLGAAVGPALLQIIVRHTARALGVKAAVACELRGEPGSEHLVPLCAWVDDKPATMTIDDARNGPCEALIKGGSPRHYPSGVRHLFPDSVAAKTIGAESFLGITLMGSDGRAIGTLGVADTKEMPDCSEALAVLRVFAARAAAEIERSHARLARRQWEHRFEAAARVAPVGLFLCDADGRCCFVNERLVQIAGWDAEDMLGDGWSRIVHPDDRTRVIGEWNEARRLARPVRFEYRLQRRDGRQIFASVLVNPEFNEAGVVCGFVGAMTDATASRDAERQHRMSTSLFTALVDSLDLPAATYSPDTTIIHANAVMAGLFENGSDRMTGTRWIDWVPEAERPAIRQMIASLTPEHPTSKHTNRKMLRDGRVVWSEWTNTATFDPAGQCVCVLGVGRIIPAPDQPAHA